MNYNWYVGPLASILVLLSAVFSVNSQPRCNTVTLFFGNQSQDVCKDNLRLVIRNNRVVWNSGRALVQFNNAQFYVFFTYEEAQNFVNAGKVFKEIIPVILKPAEPISQPRCNTVTLFFGNQSQDVCKDNLRLVIRNNRVVWNSGRALVQFNNAQFYVFFTYEEAQNFVNSGKIVYN